MTACPACDHPQKPHVTDWTRFCRRCGHWTADLAPRLDSGAMPAVEGDEPIGFLEPVRAANFKRILDRLQGMGIAGPLLDVGCGSGFFLATARDRGLSALGIEPREEMVRAAGRRGVEVRQGLFPDVLGAEERFGAILFNDVLEHIPDARAVLEGCHRHLRPGGVLVINVPNAEGLFYRLATLLRRIGVAGPFNRMWQTMFYTPHVHYFTEHSLITFAGRSGFVPACPPMRLDAVSFQGLRDRVAADDSLGPVGRAVTLAGMAALIPAASVLPADAMVGFFRASGMR